MLLRVLLCLLFLVFEPAALAARPMISEDECEQTCPDDDEHGPCSPECDDCACCAHGGRVMALVSTGERLLTASGSATIEFTSTAELSAYVEEILHVPKRVA